MSHAEPPPANLEAEEQVLASCMTSDRAIADVAEVVDPGDFYRASHGRVYAAIVSLFTDGHPVDPLTVRDELERRGELDAIGGSIRLNEIASSVGATLNVGRHAQIVADLALMRRLVTAGQRITRLGQERQGEAREVLDRAEQAMFDVAQARAAADFVEAGQVLRDVLDRIAELYESGSRVVGLPTGFDRLDSLTSGLQPGNLIVVAGRPSMGKSGLALGITANVALREEVPVALFTLEMSRAEVTQRLLSSEALIDSLKLRNGRLDKEDWQRLHNAAAKVERAPLHIDDSGAITAMEVRAKSRRLKMRHSKLGLVVVDYMQLMGAPDGAENRVQAVSQISRALKALARDLDVPVLAVSQLSRAPEQRHDKRPILSDLRESGSIEQDADLVWFVYRDDYYHPEDSEAAGIAEISIAKHRSGPTGLVKLAFTKEYVRFLDLLPTY